MITTKFMWKIIKKHDISEYHLKPTKYQHSDLPGLIRGSPQTSKITPRAPQGDPRTLPGPPRHPRTSQETPKGPQGPPSIPKACPQHVSDPPNLSNAHHKHAQSTSLIPQISPKKPMWLRTIYRFLTFIISAIWALVAYGSAGDAKRIQYYINI